MRDIALTLIFAGLLPTVFFRPWMGVLLWCWFSYMNPHRLCYGFAVEMPFAQIIALATMSTMLFSKEKYTFTWTRETKTLVLFVVWVFITTLDAKYQQLAWSHLIKVYKIQLMTLITLLLINSKEKLNWTIWSVAVSLGLFGVKGGIFTLLTGGAHRVQGPANSFIGGNNEIGLALLMVFPLMNYLRLQATNAYIKMGLAAAMVLTFFAIIGTHSRGALVGLVVTGSVFFIRARQKFIWIFVLAIILPAGYQFMPEHWHERMATIQTYEEDRSAQGRLYAWSQAIGMANREPFTGYGFNSIYPEIHIDIHSIYFEVLGEHGWAGLALFLLLGTFSFLSARDIAKRAAHLKDAAYLKDLGDMLQVSLLAYASTGAFLGLAYFDFFYHLVAFVVIARCLLQQELDKATSSTHEKPDPGKPGKRFGPRAALYSKSAVKQV